MIEFDKRRIEEVGGDWEEASQANLIYEEISSKRISKLDVNDNFIKSKLAWKIAVLEQSLRYRISSLIEGAMQSWNSQNTLSAIVQARCMLETSASILEVHRRIMDHLARKDFNALNALADKVTFSTREKEWLNEFPEHQATSVLTEIDKLDKRLPGVRNHYDGLSEIVHPNSRGHFSFFTTIDWKNMTVNFSDKKRHTDDSLRSILLSCLTTNIASTCLDEIASSIPEIAELVPTPRQA